MRARAAVSYKVAVQKSGSGSSNNWNLSSLKWIRSLVALIICARSMKSKDAYLEDKMSVHSGRKWPGYAQCLCRNGLSIIREYITLWVMLQIKECELNSRVWCKEATYQSCFVLLKNSFVERFVAYIFLHMKFGLLWWRWKLNISYWRGSCYFKRSCDSLFVWWHPTGTQKRIKMAFRTPRWEQDTRSTAVKNGISRASSCVAG